MFTCKTLYGGFLDLTFRIRFSCEYIITVTIGVFPFTQFKRNTQCVQTVAVDIVGLFPTSPAGNNYILVAMDYFICVNVLTNSIQNCFE